MGGPERMNKLDKWKDEDWKLEIEISEAKQNEVKRKLEAKDQGARKEEVPRARH